MDATFLPEFFRHDGDDTLGYPPLELERRDLMLQWRGVRFGSITEELYYEADGSNISENEWLGVTCCAETGCKVDLGNENPWALCADAPEEVHWENAHLSSIFYQSQVEQSSNSLKEYIGKGLSNAVLVANARYENFNIPDPVDQVKIDPKFIMTIAVCYVHKTEEANGLLKADDFQIAQLETILTAVRKNAPKWARYVRVWTDQALEFNLREGGSSSNPRPKWILHGLLPFAVFTTAVLFSGDHNDEMSTWPLCEQILAEGGCGCLFLSNLRPKGPVFCKEIDSSTDFECVSEVEYTGKSISVLKTVGDGLSVRANLRRLSSVIHAGVLDDTITYHIADAQVMLRLSYFITNAKSDEHLPFTHAFDCDACLNATYRENAGYFFALKICSDNHMPREAWGLQRIRCQVRFSFPYPKVRSRRGYETGHGVREFLPGAGRFAKGTFSDMTRDFRKNL